jgi:hypothetical protein
MSGLQQRLNTIRQAVQTIRFGNDRFDPGGGGQRSAHEVSVNCKENDGNPGHNAAENRRGFHSIHSWHSQVDNNQVGFQRFGFFNGVDAINGFSANLDTAILEKNSDYVANGVAIVNKQDLAEGERRNGRGRGVGLRWLRHADLTAEYILGNMNERPEFVGFEMKISYDVGRRWMKDYIVAGKAFCQVQYSGLCGIQVGDPFDPDRLADNICS